MKKLYGSRPTSSTKSLSDNPSLRLPGAVTFASILGSFYISKPEKTPLPTLVRLLAKISYDETPTGGSNSFGLAKPIPGG